MCVCVCLCARARVYVELKIFSENQPHVLLRPNSDQKP